MNNSSARSALKRSFLVFAALICAAPALAQEKPEAPVRTDPNTVKLESIGTLQSTREGNLGKAIWRDLSEREIRVLVAGLPDNRSSATLNDLHRRLLLSQADTNRIERLSPPASETLLALRMEKLLEGGWIREVQDLYNIIPKDLMTPDLARLGISGLVLDGKFPTACLEDKAVRQKLKVEGAFWHNLSALCARKYPAEHGAAEAVTFDGSKVLETVYNPSAAFTLPVKSADSVRDLGPLELAAAFHEGHVRLASDDIIPLLPNRIVYLIIASNKFPGRTVFSAYTHLASQGLMSSKDLGSFYKEIGKESAEDADPAPWKKLPLLYVAASSAEDEAVRAPLLRQALEHDKTVNASLLPFADMVAKTDPAGASADLTRRALALMLMAGLPVPEAWMAQIQAVSAENPLFPTLLEMLPLYGLTEKTGKTSVENLRKALITLDVKTSEQLIIFTTLLDKGQSFTDNPARVYEKHLGLTSYGNYVMPSYVLADRLDQAESQQQPGLVVLISLNMLPDRPGIHYPGTLREVLRSLLSVGYEKEARAIVREVLAGLLV